MSEPAQPKKMTIVAWSGTLDKAWPTLILATTAAASGMDVAVFFTFWGLRILQKNSKRTTGRTWRSSASAWPTVAIGGWRATRKECGSGSSSPPL